MKNTKDNDRSIDDSKFEVIAVAIETAIQNGGIGVVVLNLTFPRSLHLTANNRPSEFC